MVLNTCIWLNLFKREGDATKGIPYWKIAEDLITSICSSSDKAITYSGIVVREMQIKTSPFLYSQFRAFVEKNCVHVSLLTEDKQKARKLESFYNFSINYYDLLHLCITERLDGILVTRDKRLIEISKENDISVIMPEEFTNY